MLKEYDPLIVFPLKEPLTLPVKGLLLEQVSDQLNDREFPEIVEVPFPPPAEEPVAEQLALTVIAQEPLSEAPEQSLPE